MLRPVWSVECGSEAGALCRVRNLSPVGERKAVCERGDWVAYCYCIDCFKWHSVCLYRAVCDRLGSCDSAAKEACYAHAVSLSTSMCSFVVSSLPIDSLLSQQPHTRSGEFLSPFDSLLLHKPDVESDESALSIDVLPLYQTRCRGDFATTITSFIR